METTKENLDLERLRSMIEGGIPYLKNMGIKVLNLKPFKVKLQLPHNPQNLNYIGTCHAGAIFTFGETCGGALIGASFDLSKYFLVVKSAYVEYLKPIKDLISCETGISEQEHKRVVEEIERKGKSLLTISLSLLNEGGEDAARLELTYVLKKR